MKYFVFISGALAILAAGLFSIPSADAQSYYNKRSTASGKTDSSPSTTSVDHAARVSRECPKNWEAQSCLKAVSESNLVLAANYAGVLQKKKKNNAVEDIKQHCAAATAGSKGEYPAYAMRSAFVECANIIVDVSDSTGIDPDKSHYQLLVGAVLCLDGDRRCSYIEQGLQRY